MIHPGIFQVNLSIMIKKKLLQINSVINSGSTGRIAEDIGVKAMDNGWESYIAYGRNDGQSLSNKIKIGNKWDIRWHGVQTRLFDRHGFASKKATVKLVKQIQKIGPDIIHLHNLHGYYLNIEILFNYLADADIPIVWTLHDCWPMTGHCPYFSYVKCDRWKTHCHNCPQKTNYPSSLCLDRSSQNHKLKQRFFCSVKNMTIVPVSNWLSDIVSKSYFRSYPHRVIHNGVNTNIFSLDKDGTNVRVKYHLQNRMVLLGVAGVWEERKGLRDFIELSRKIPEDVSIVLVGLTEKQIRELPPNIIGIKRTESIYELAELYNAADLFVNPTWEDNFPTTNLEALACGTPVLTYATGGSVEAVTHDTGFVVEQGGIDGILRCVETIKGSKKASYSVACRKRAVENYNKDDRYNEYIRLYEELL